MRIRLLFLGAIFAALSIVGGPDPLHSETTATRTERNELRFSSFHLGGELVLTPVTFGPIEAESLVLPLMKENKELFNGKTVLEIGTGSGIISIYAAQLGAKKVVATDISRDAIRTAARNAARFEVASVVETRLVPRSDMSAYSVIRAHETFDIIISNPPYSLKLDAPTNNAVIDRGDLGFSIVKGLRSHLRPDGVAILLYNSLFYHLAMVKFARYSRAADPQKSRHWTWRKPTLLSFSPSLLF